MKIRRKFTISMLLAALVPLFLAMGLALWEGSRQTKSMSIEQAFGQLETAAQKISGFFQIRMAEVSAYSEMPLFKTMNFSKLKPFLMSELARHQTVYETFILSNPLGHFYNTAGGNPYLGGLRSFDDTDTNAKPKSIHKRDYWLATVGKNNLAENVTFLSDPMISYTTGVKQVVVASTILTKDKQVVGMIGAALPWQDIRRRLEDAFKHASEHFNWNSKFFLISPNGTYWYHWDHKKVVQFKKNDQGKHV